MKEHVISYKDLRVGETYTVTRGRHRVKRLITAIEESPYGKRAADNTRILFREGGGPTEGTLFDSPDPVKSCTAKSFCRWFRRKAKYVPGSY